MRPRFGGNEAASLRLTIPPLVTFLPGALLTTADVDRAMGETVTGASRFVAGLLQLALLDDRARRAHRRPQPPPAPPLSGGPISPCGLPFVGGMTPFVVH